MYYPQGFDRKRAIELADLVDQAYTQVNAFLAEEAWRIEGGYTLIAEIRYAGTAGAASGKNLTSFDKELRKLPAGKVLRKGESPLPIGFIARRGAETFLVFRGTTTSKEWLQDFNIRLTAYPYGRFGRIHEGFLRTYEVFRQTILDAMAGLGKTRRLFVTGHSLGAGLATVAALDIASATGLGAPILYNFASPRVGDAAFVRAYNDVMSGRSYRLMNTCDMVVSVPFPVPFLGFLGGYFTHVDTPVCFTTQHEDMERNHHLDTYRAALKSRPLRSGLFRKLFG